jgi:small membrane protein
MRLFQIIALPFIAVMLAVSVRNLFKTPVRLPATLFWVLLWLATMVAVMYPDSTTRLARALGIYRGADLLVYSAVIAFSVGFYVVSLRLRQISRELTVLTREVALLNAERPQGSPPVRPT